MTQHNKRAEIPNKDLKPLDIDKWGGGEKNLKRGCPPDSFYPTKEKVIVKMLKPLDCLFKKACYVASQSRYAVPIASRLERRGKPIRVTYLVEIEKMG